MRNWTICFFLILAILSSQSVSASAVVCNQSSTIAHVAISLDGDASYGWWVIWPGHCSTVNPNFLTPGGKFLVYAVGNDGREWYGPYGMCVAPIPFALSLNQRCSQFYYRKGFFGKDVDHYGNVEVYLPGTSAEPPYQIPAWGFAPPSPSGDSTTEWINKILKEVKRNADAAPKGESSQSESNKCNTKMSCAALQQQFNKYSQIVDSGLEWSRRSSSPAGEAMRYDAMQAARLADLCQEAMHKKRCFR